MKKIVLISQNASPGFTIFRKSFIKFLVQQGHEVFAFAIDYTPETIDRVRSLGATPIAYSLNKAGLNPLRDIYDTYMLSRKLKELKADVVFSFFIKPSIYGTIAAWMAGVPRRIAMLEGLGYIYTASKDGLGLKKIFLQYVHGGLASLGYAFANKVLFLNFDDPKDLLKRAYVDHRKITILGPVGLDLSEYPYMDLDLAKPIRFIFVARLLAEKGVFEYLDAASMVKKRHPQVKFLILGGFDKDNPASLTEVELEEVINKGIVEYVGHVSNVAEYIANSHVFVLPSYREGFPRSTQEAMAIGRAIITTDVAGCRETVLEGVNGFKVPPFNSEAIKEKMMYLIENPERMREMGYQSHCLAASEFEAEKINEKLYRLLVG
ncbi:glycosyltransferase family 4 protein [Pseudidiomarina gelatinasegens]|uniref:glycosyltransferase family 4 protein n=1 Tax=Pseudidiomarina gelatinasegens TaxID=2487740 RepID=UPI003A9882F3